MKIRILFLISLTIIFSNCHFDENLNNTNKDDDVEKYFGNRSKILITNPLDSAGIYHNQCLDYILASLNNHDSTHNYFLYNNEPYLLKSSYDTLLHYALKFGIINGITTTDSINIRNTLYNIFNDLDYIQLINFKEYIYIPINHLLEFYNDLHSEGYIRDTIYNLLFPVVQAMTEIRIDDVDSLFDELLSLELSLNEFPEVYRSASIWTHSIQHWYEKNWNPYLNYYEIFKNELKIETWADFAKAAIAGAADVIVATVTAPATTPLLGGLLGWGSSQLVSAAGSIDLGPCKKRCPLCGECIDW